MEPPNFAQSTTTFSVPVPSRLSRYPVKMLILDKRKPIFNFWSDKCRFWATDFRRTVMLFDECVFQMAEFDTGEMEYKKGTWRWKEWLRTRSDESLELQNFKKHQELVFNTSGPPQPQSFSCAKHLATIRAWSGVNIARKLPEITQLKAYTTRAIFTWFPRLSNVRIRLTTFLGLFWLLNNLLPLWMLPGINEGSAMYATWCDACCAVVMRRVSVVACRCGG